MSESVDLKGFVNFLSDEFLQGSKKHEELSVNKNNESQAKYMESRAHAVAKEVLENVANNLPELFSRWMENTHNSNEVKTVEGEVA